MEESAGSRTGNRGAIVRPRPRRANLRVTFATTSSISVAWDPSTDNVRVRGYYVYVDGNRSTVSTTAYTIWQLSCGESVAVEVEAFDRAGNRSPRASATVSSAPCPDRSPPTAPSRFRQVATSDTAVVLAWTASTDDTGVVGYGVYRSGLPMTTSPEPSVTLAPLSCGSTYEYAVDAVDAAGNRSSRSPVWVVTSPCASPPPPGDTEPPSKPLASLGTSTSTSLVLQWQPAADNVGVHHYDVFLGTSAAASAEQKVGETTALSYTYGGLACGTDYSLAVQAVDAAGNKSALAEAPARTLECPAPAPPPDTTPPSQPGNLAVAAATASSIALTWSASTDNVGVTGYGVYRNGTSLPPVTQPGTTVSGLQCGTAYTLEVDAVDAAGYRSTRAAVTASTTACPDTQPPTAPTNVTATSRTTTSIALTWSPSTDAVGVVGYGLYRGTQFVGTATGTTGIFSDLECDTAYTLSIDAYDAAGNRSAKTTPVMVATTACPPPPSPTITMGESSIMGVNDTGNGNLLVSQKATLAQTGILRRLSFYVTTAAGNLRLGVYAPNGPSGGPGQKLAETASFVPTAGWNTVNVLSPVTLAAGSYWLAYLPSSSSLAFRVGSGGEARWQSFSYGSMPATFPTSPNAEGVRWSLYATLDVTDEAPPPLPPPPVASVRTEPTTTRTARSTSATPAAPTPRTTTRRIGASARTATAAVAPAHRRSSRSTEGLATTASSRIRCPLGRLLPDRRVGRVHHESAEHRDRQERAGSTPTSGSLTRTPVTSRTPGPRCSTSWSIAARAAPHRLRDLRAACSTTRWTCNRGRPRARTRSTRSRRRCRTTAACATRTTARVFPSGARSTSAVTTTPRRPATSTRRISPPWTCTGTPTRTRTIRRRTTTPGGTAGR